MNIGIGNIGLGGLDQAELQRRIAQYQSGIGSVPAPTPKPTPAPVVTPRPAPAPVPIARSLIASEPEPPAPVFSRTDARFEALPPVSPAPAPAPAPPAPVSPAPVAPSSITQEPEPPAPTFEKTDVVLPPAPPTKRKAVPELIAPVDTKVGADAVTSGFADYKQTLLDAGTANTTQDPDDRDDYYNTAFSTLKDDLQQTLFPDVEKDTTDGKARGEQYVSGKQAFLIDPADYAAQTGSPEYVKGLYQKDLRGGVEVDAVKDAYSTISEVSGVTDTAAALSSHYGFDITPSEETLDITTFGGAYDKHTAATSDEISEFQSLVKPILAESVTFLQATEGLSYQDALLESYKRDPMMQSLYAKYGITPVRQTDDGSTYLYDPLSFSEIRTKEVKDTSVKDAIKIAAIIAASAYGGAALAGSGLFGGAGAAGAGAAGAAVGARRCKM